MEGKLSVLLTIIAAILMVGWLVYEVSQFEASDTSFNCRPGETYTTAECR